MFLPESLEITIELELRGKDAPSCLVSVSEARMPEGIDPLKRMKDGQERTISYPHEPSMNLL